jgi:probable HAF family extracellular repeat protein
MSDLGTLGGSNSSARGINDPSQVVGYSDTANRSQHAFLWTSTAGMTDLGTLRLAANGFTGRLRRT